MIVPKAIRGGSLDLQTDSVQRSAVYSVVDAVRWDSIVGSVWASVRDLVASSVRGSARSSVRDSVEASVVEEFDDEP